MLDSNTLYTALCLFEHVFLIPKKLEFQTTIFLCAATLHEAIIHLLCMFKEHNKNRKFEVSFTSFKKKKLHPYYRHLIMQFLCINANFITIKVTVVLYIHICSFPSCVSGCTWMHACMTISESLQLSDEVY